MTTASRFRTNSKRWIVLVALDILLFAAMSISVFFPRPPPARVQGIMGNQGMYLSTEQILILEAQARSGSDSAAVRLSNFYYFFDQSPSKALFWAHMGASHGGAQSQRQYGAMIELGVGVAGNGVISPEERDARTAEKHKSRCLSVRQHMPAAIDKIQRAYGDSPFSACLQF